MVDAFLTVGTWLPSKIADNTSDEYQNALSNAYTERRVFVIAVGLVGLLLTNVFTTPIIYFIFNRQFRVGCI